MDDERPRDPASLVRYMDAIDEPARDDGPTRVHMAGVTFDHPADEPLKVVPVQWLPGDGVRLKGSPRERGVVIGVGVRPTGLSYEVSWPRSRTVTDHYGLELDDAD